MWESRVLQRAFERLELHEGKLSRAVLRGGGGGDVTSLPDAGVGNHPGLPGPLPPLVVGHTHQPMWYRSPEGGLVVNPGSVVSMPVVDLSRTFAVADLANLNVTFHAVESGEPIPLAPWD